MAYLYWSECLFPMTLLPEPQPVAKSAHKIYSKGVKSVGHGKQHADLYTDLHQQYGDMFKQYADKHMAGGCVINVGHPLYADQQGGANGDLVIVRVNRWSLI